jgi:hypothetical protein
MAGSLAVPICVHCQILPTKFLLCHELRLSSPSKCKRCNKGTTTCCLTYVRLTESSTQPGEYYIDPNSKSLDFGQQVTISACDFALEEIVKTINFGEGEALAIALFK